jgi:hypothetical protein
MGGLIDDVVEPWNFEKTTFSQINYLILVNISYVILGFLIIAGLMRIDFYHAVLLIIFVWATLKPDAF